jgi:hypothetical protein
MKRKHVFFLTVVIFLVVLISFISHIDDLKIVVNKLNDEQSNNKIKLPGRSIDYEFQRLKNPYTNKIPQNIRRRENLFTRAIPNAEGKSDINSINKNLNSRFKWINRGPANVAGRTRALGIDIKNASNVLAGSVSGGLWKSTDKGKNWQKVSLALELQNISCLVQDTRSDKENTWYYGTGEYAGGFDQARDLVPYQGDGIYKSFDNGDTWQLLGSTSVGNQTNWQNDFRYVFKLAIDPSNSTEDELYAAAWGSIYRSNNGGQTWTKVLGGNRQAVGYSDVAVTSDGTVYATLCWGAQQGIWMSNDGFNWLRITPTGWPVEFNRTLIAVAPSDEKVVYFFGDHTPLTNIEWVLGYYPVTHKCLWKYKHESISLNHAVGDWQNLSENIPMDLCTLLSYAMLLDVYPEDENVVFLGGQYLWRSMDGFTSSDSKIINGWHKTSNVLLPGMHPDVHKLVFSRSSLKSAYLIHDGGISKTSDIISYPWKDVRWTSLKNGYRTTQCYTAAVVPNKANDPRILACIHDNGVYVTNSSEPDAGWDWLQVGDGAFASFYDGGAKMISSLQHGEIFMFKQIPENIISANPTRINPGTAADYIFITPFVLDPNNEQIMYLAVGNRVYRNKDLNAITLNGSRTPKDEYWDVLTTNTVGYVSALAVSKTPANILYYGTSSGELFKIHNASSQIAPAVAVNIFANKNLPGAYVSNIAIDPYNGDFAIISFSNYGLRSIFATNNGADIWMDVSGNLEENPDGSGSGPAVNWVAILPQNDEKIYFAGTTAGLFSTSILQDNETVWKREGAETIGYVNVKMVSTREVDGKVVIATYGNGIYSRNYDVTQVDERAKKPNRFVLHQNYPNPFNEETIIAFELEHPSPVTLTIFDLLGNEIQTLVNHKIYQEGSHVIRLNNHTITSGVYIYRLKVSNNFSQVKKMCYLK